MAAYRAAIEILDNSNAEYPCEIARQELQVLSYASGSSVGETPNLFDADFAENRARSATA